MLLIYQQIEKGLTESIRQTFSVRILKQSPACLELCPAHMS